MTWMQINLSYPYKTSQWHLLAIILAQRSYYNAKNYVSLVTEIEMFHNVTLQNSILLSVVTMTSHRKLSTFKLLIFRHIFNRGFKIKDFINMKRKLVWYKWITKQITQHCLHLGQNKKVLIVFYIVLFIPNLLSQNSIEGSLFDQQSLSLLHTL